MTLSHLQQVAVDAMNLLLLMRLLHSLYVKRTRKKIGSHMNSHIFITFSGEGGGGGGGGGYIAFGFLSHMSLEWSSGYRILTMIMAYITLF